MKVSPDMVTMESLPTPKIPDWPSPLMVSSLSPRPTMATSAGEAEPIPIEPLVSVIVWPARFESNRMTVGTPLLSAEATAARQRAGAAVAIVGDVVTRILDGADVHVAAKPVDAVLGNSCGLTGIAGSQGGAARQQRGHRLGWAAVVSQRGEHRRSR